AVPTRWRSSQAPNRSAALALALAASSSRFFGVAVVSSERKSRALIPAICSMAFSNASSLAFDGLLNPVILRTNCSEAARTSSSVTGGSKLKSVLMFLHILIPLSSRRSRLRLQRVAALETHIGNKDQHDKCDCGNHRPG